MNSNVKDFNLKQLYKEIEYINKTYFFDLRKKEETTKKEDNLVKSDVILNLIPYTMYQLQNLSSLIFLIPKNFKTLDKDFDNIIVYSASKFGLHFSIIKRLNNEVELMGYDFLTNDQNYSTGSYRHYYFDDNNKKLQKIFLEKNTDIISFLRNENYSQLFNYSMNKLKRNFKETKLNRIYGDSLFDAFQTYEKNFEIIDDNESPLMKILTDLEIKKVK